MSAGNDLNTHPALINHVGGEGIGGVAAIWPGPIVIVAPDVVFDDCGDPGSGRP